MITSWLLNLPIRRKLILITLCTASMALVAALFAFLGVQLKLARDSAASDLSALAQIVAANAAGPLAFGDREAARTTLRSLDARSDIRSARLLDATGREFGFVDFDHGAPTLLATPEPRGQPQVVVRRSAIFVVQPVIHEGETLGRLELAADVRGVLLRLFLTGAGVLPVILALALVLAYALVSRLQGAITTPLSVLADTARAIALKKDYSLRVTRMSDDEIGELTTAFNSMLAQVDERDLAVSATRQQLAAQVTVLQHEIAERERAENQLQRAKEEAEAANRSKSAFLAAMSHEIRTPMNGVLATASLLLDSPLNDEQRELSSLIRVSGEGLLTVLNDILDFSKIEAGRVRLENTRFDLRDLIEDAVELHAVGAAGKGLDVAADLPPGLSTAVRGDPYRLRQVMMNLVGNAVKFTAHGEVVVSVSASAGTPPADGALLYRFEVTDSGIGLTAEAQGQLFKPFTQADSSTTRKFGGTGLGLAISKGLVELMGGNIGVRSEPGKGSTFWFTAPLQVQPGVSPVHPEPARLHGRRLLVVEPNEGNRQRLRRQLANWSIDVLEAADADSAMAATIAAGSGSGRKRRDQGAARDEFPVLEEKVGEMEVAAALICLNPADGPGLALARRLHAETAWKQRPVILLTNQAERLAARAVNSEGVSACLFRPMRMRQLAATLERLLAPAGEESAAAPVASSGVSGKQLHVLLVEDNPVNQRVGSLMLQKSACAVTLAPNGRHALEELEIRSYDLVLMDCQMPELDGFETTRRIRANEAAGRWPGRRRQLVVAMTANAMEGDRERCLQAGMDNYLPKPMRPEQLRAILQQAERDRDAESAGARSA